MKLSILIPSYNWDCTELVNDLLEQIPDDAEIIVGNDKSTTEDANKSFQKISSLKQCRVFEPNENIGRSRIRNRLFDLSSGEWILFLDSDVKIDSPYFVKNYLDAIESNPSDIYYGGIKNTVTCPKGCELRWKYETDSSKKLTIEYRNNHPYDSLTTANFVISREAFVQTGFNEDITHYGYEDTLLFTQLEKLGKSVHHIENRVIHLNIESNSKFLAKARQALRTLKSLPENQWPNSKLVRYYKLLKRLHLHRMFALIHIMFLPITRKILYSRHVSLTLFQFYKLGYLCGL